MVKQMLGTHQMKHTQNFSIHYIKYRESIEYILYASIYTVDV